MEIDKKSLGGNIIYEEEFEKNNKVLLAINNDMVFIDQNILKWGKGNEL